MPRPSLLLVSASLACLALSACEHHEEHAHHPHAKIVTTSPAVKDVTLTQQYVAQIHSRRHINVCALEGGYLEEITVREGQAVKKGDVLFKVVPVLYQAKMEAEQAEVRLAEIKLKNNQRLYERGVVSEQEVFLSQAELAKVQARLKLAQAELNFATVRAPFDGIVDRLQQMQGSLVKEGEVLTTLSDNDTMWVYFNVPEARYLDYMAAKGQDQAERIELVLANSSTFPHPGKIAAIEGQFNNETGNIPFRADFPNPDRLLRHGQTGNVLVRRDLKAALVIPQRATFEVLDKRYVFVVGPDGKARQREIKVQHELEDTFVIAKGLAAGEKFVLEGVRQVHDGDEVESDFRAADVALANQKQRAE